jgi:hypothetical protein
MDEYGSASRHATAAAAAAARSLANGDVDARWRADDGEIEVVRDRFGRIELHRFHADGRSSLIEYSRRSVLRAGYHVAFFVGFGLLVAEFMGGVIAGSVGHESLEDALFTAFVLTVVAVLVAGFLTPSADKAVQRWIRGRFGTEAGWARVPREGELGSATGNQQVTAAAVADGAGRSAHARLRDDGTLEVATRRWRAITVHYVDRNGVVTHTAEHRRGDGPALKRNDGWRRVQTSEPAD